MNDDQKPPGPNYRLPIKEEKYKDDPYAEQRAYFAYWEAVELERRRKAQQRQRGLSVYERTREKYPNSF